MTSSEIIVRLDIIIVNWNSVNQLFECLSSIQRHGHKEVARIIVVDNASMDGSAEGIAGRFDLPLEIVRNDENLGFARACNQGVQLGKAPYLLFLNPDTRLFEGSLSKPLTFMEQKENRHVGICGIQLVDEYGRVWRTCARFPSLRLLTGEAFGLDKFPGLECTGMQMKEWNHMHSRAVNQIMGAFFLVRRDLFEALGGFDERFFVYFEEVDFSFRVQKAAYKSIYFTDVHAYHVGGGTSRQVKAKRLFYFLRSRMIYGFKHFSHLQAWILVGVTMIVEPASRFLFSALRRDRAGIVDTINAYCQLWRALPRIIASRRQVPN